MANKDIMIDHQDRPAAASPHIPGQNRRPTNTRDKPQLSCNLCRRRKLRCNRERPCSNCTKRGLEQSCTYADNNAFGMRNRPQQESTNIKDRIRELESLVVKLMQGTATPETILLETQANSSAASPLHDVHTSDSVLMRTPMENATDSQSSSEGGSMKSSNSGTSYVGSSHWAAVLDSIAELKQHFDREPEAHISPHTLDAQALESPGPVLLYSCPRYANRDGIIDSIPARPVVDRLISRYFNSFDMYPAVLHNTQFMEEYEQFWANPATTPTMWLGLLFSVMCLAVHVQSQTSNPGTQAGASPFSTLSVEPDLLNMAEAFREKTVLCLMLGKYTKGGTYVLETMILYLASEHFISKDADLGIWILLGAIVQLAMHMGYHKDPRHFPRMSPLVGEMRRRVWATIVELDLGISAQMGLPRLIKRWQADTQEPRNLLDRDFDKTTVNIPEGRPKTVITPMLYRLAKGRIMSVLGMISDLSSDARSCAHAEVAKMDKKLDAARASFPGCLKWQSLTHCITDPANIIMQKIFLKMLFWKSKILLHRRYLTSRQSSGSQRACLDAALKMLVLQETLEEETQPYGQLYQERWKVSSMVNHNFLLATSILWFYMQRKSCNVGDDEESITLECVRRSLLVSHDIWLRSSNFSNEAHKAADAIAIVMSNCNATSGAEMQDVGNDADGGLLPFYDYGNTALGFSDHLYDGSLAPFSLNHLPTEDWDTQENDSALLALWPMSTRLSTRLDAQVVNGTQ